MFTIIILYCDSGHIWWHYYTIAKPSLVSRVKGQADIECFVILWNTVIHNGQVKGELTYTITERAQTEVGEVTIVTRSYRWVKCELV